MHAPPLNFAKIVIHFGSSTGGAVDEGVTAARTEISPHGRMNSIICGIVRIYYDILTE